MQRCRHYGHIVVVDTPHGRAQAVEEKRQARYPARRDSVGDRLAGDVARVVVKAYHQRVAAAVVGNGRLLPHQALLHLASGDGECGEMQVASGDREVLRHRLGSAHHHALDRQPRLARLAIRVNPNRLLKGAWPTSRAIGDFHRAALARHDGLGVIFCHRASARREHPREHQWRVAIVLYRKGTRPVALALMESAKVVQGLVPLRLGLGMSP